MPGTRHHTLSVALTVDVDPDANRPVRGRTDAVGPDGAEPTTDACAEGLALLAGLLQEMRLPATIFWEGRTLDTLAAGSRSLTKRLGSNPQLEHGSHGWRHEDFAGAVSGLPLDASATAEALDEAARAFCAVFGRQPTAFRAPYCRLTPVLASALAARGYRYDASLTRAPGSEWAMRPYRPDGAPTLWELALCRGTDSEGRPMSGYVWPLLEGARAADDYVHLVEWARDGWPGGLLQIALHPWHLAVSEQGVSFADGTGWRGFERLIRRLTKLPGVAFTTCGGYLGQCLSG